jgi:diguanylate cyclase (GGDEF)-like protein
MPLWRPGLSAIRRSPIVFASPARSTSGTTKGRNRELLEALDRRLRSLRDREDSPYYLYRSRWFYDEDLTVFPRWGIALILGGAALILLLAALATIWALKERVIRRQSRLLSRSLRYEQALSACARLLLSGGELPETLRLFRERLGTGSEALFLSLRLPPAPDGPEVESPEDDRTGLPLEGGLPPDPSGAALSEGPRVTFPLLEGEGRYGELIATYRPGFSPDEEERTFLSAGADLIGAYLERHRAEARLRELARTDPLTGIANRRTLFEEADREIRRCLRRGRPLAFALLDVDRFKDVNDGFGHDAGDRILRELARILAEGLRSEDLVGRLGGEEFGLLLPETDLPGAFLTMERLRSAVEETPFALHGEGSGDAPPETIRITVSLGLALLAPAEAGFEPLYRRADQALYRAKSLGRNRVVTEDLLSAPSSSAPRPAEESPSLLSGPRGRS